MIMKRCGYAVSPEFCRTLERELAAMTADRNSVQADLNDLRMAYKERGEERDALRSELAQFQQPTSQEKETK